MNQRVALVVILISGLVMTVYAQKRPYDVVMKDIGATYANLKKNLDASAMAPAAEDAAKLQNLFKETEDFWTPFKTKDAIEAAKAAGATSQTIATAAKEGNAQKAQAAYGAIAKNCKSCHDAHRELMPDKSFKIKP
jgi:cytochrome c556